jgi:hypothetical protein
MLTRITATYNSYHYIYLFFSNLKKKKKGILKVKSYRKTSDVADKVFKIYRLFKPCGNKIKMLNTKKM